jgi:predicted aldo/keto reductase-like oxidoreductase
MRHITLGRTGLQTSVIGIGLEHLLGQPRETVISTIHRAIEAGINYFDVVYSLPDYLDDVGAAFQGHREGVLLTAHLGSTSKDGQYYKTRSAKRCEATFQEVLERLHTSYVDVLFLHNFNSPKEWERASGRYRDLALRLREEGKARVLGISGHHTEVMERAIEEGIVDVIMFPVNLFNHAMPRRQELLTQCAEQAIGMVAMKPFGGGKLLKGKGTVRVPKYQTGGGEAFTTKIRSDVTPIQCLSYVMSQVGVSIALPGVRNPGEVTAALDTLAADEETRDFSALLTDFDRYVEGECTYCNHCLPCPAHIDIAQVNRLLDEARLLGAQSLQDAYCAMPAPASACTECGACVTRCPFGVDVTAKIEEAIAVFEG